MKRIKLVIHVILLLIFLAACSSSEDTSNSETQDDKESVETTEEVPEESNNPEEEKVVQESEKIKEIFLKSQTAGTEITSFSAKMDFQQEVIGDKSETINTTMEMKVIQEPMTMYQKFKMDMGSAGDNIDMEMYIIEDVMYVYQPGVGWMKIPANLEESPMNISINETNPVDEMVWLENYMENFELTENHDSYILSFTATGEEYKEFMEAILNQSFVSDINGTYSTEGTTIHELSYEMVISKDNMFPMKFTVVMDMEMTSENETVRLIQTMKSEYDDYNQINEIIVPEEVVNSAMDLTGY